MSDLINRKTLLEEMNNKEIEIEFELPVQEILGKDIDMDDFCMLVQEIIKKYRELIIGVIRKQSTAYNVEKVVEQIEKQIKWYDEYEDICLKRGDEKEAHTFSCLSGGLYKALEFVRNGGNADVPEINVGDNGWIPVTKRLPNEDEMKRAYCRNHYGSEFIVMIAGANRPTTLYRTMDGFWVDEEREIYSVVAWQPLPEPYEVKT